MKSAPVGVAQRHFLLDKQSVKIFTVAWCYGNDYHSVATIPGPAKMSSTGPCMTARAGIVALAFWFFIFFWPIQAKSLQYSSNDPLCKNSMGWAVVGEAVYGGTSVIRERHFRTSGLSRNGWTKALALAWSDSADRCGEHSRGHCRAHLVVQTSCLVV